MDENINFIRNLSLGVLILGLLLLVVAILIFWKFDLLDYYRFKTGKKMKKTNSTSQSTVSQYYSEQLTSDDSHEIINLFKLAMDNGVKADYFKGQIFTHPTMSESLNDLFAQF